MFQTLKRLLGREPRAVSSLDGFSITLEKRPGVLLTSTPQGNPDAEPRPESQDYYYEVTVKHTGNSPEYPANAELRHQYTVALGSSSYGGTIGPVSYLRPGGRWLRFEVLEAYYDGKMRPGMMGKQMPAHHYVALRGCYRDEKGRESHQEIGIFVPKSTLESDAWRMAASSPITCM